MTYNADIIFLFNRKDINKRKSIDSKMTAFRRHVIKKYGVKGVIWGFGNHYDKSTKGKETWYVCFSNDATKNYEMHFYANNIMGQILVDFNAIFHKQS